MGGGSGSGSMQSTTVTSNIPEYAKPYVENMLGAAEQQIFTTGADGSYTGYRPYQPYSVNPQDYFAGPTQAQQQSYAEALGMQTPGQYATGTGLAALAGTGQLGLTNTAQQYGSMGAGYGNTAAGYGAMGAGYGAQGAGYGAQAAQLSNMGFGAGSDYDATVTNSDLFSPYMSPFVQQVIQPQLAKAQSDYEMASTQANLASARQGTYGGARQALQQSEREKGLNINKSNIIGQGLQNAYDKAMQSIQFGAGLGLQGVQTGYQGLGMGMQGAGMGLQGAQSGMQGAQLGMQGAGLGMQGASVGLQGVGTAQQGLAGASSTGATLANIGTAAQQSDLARLQMQNAMGSQYQDYQQGIINQAVQDYATAQQYPYMQLGMMSSLVRGLPIQNMTTQQYQAQPSIVQQGAGLLGAYGAYTGAFKEGGTVTRYDVGGSVENKIKKMAEVDPSGKGLAQLMAKSSSPTVKRMIAEELDAPRMAGGGTPPARRNTLKEQLESMNEAYSTMGIPAPGQAGEQQGRLQQLLEDQQANAGARYDEDSRLRKAMAFLEFGSNPYGPLRGAISGGQSFLGGEAAARQNARAAELQRAQALAGLEQSRISGAQQHIGNAAATLHRQNALDQKMQIEQGKINARLTAAEIAAGGANTRAGMVQDRMDARARDSAELRRELARQKAASGGRGAGALAGYGVKDAAKDADLVSKLSPQLATLQQNIRRAKAQKQDTSELEAQLAKISDLSEAALARHTAFHEGKGQEQSYTPYTPIGKTPVSALDQYYAQPPDDELPPLHDAVGRGLIAPLPGLPENENEGVGDEKNPKYNAGREKVRKVASFPAGVPAGMTFDRAKAIADAARADPNSGNFQQSQAVYAQIAEWFGGDTDKADDFIKRYMTPESNAGKIPR